MLRKIVFDARMVREIPDGIARHAFELVNAMGRLSPPFRLSVLLSDPKGKEHFLPSSHVELIEHQPSFLSLEEQRKLQKTIRAIHPSLCHFPSFVVPRGIDLPYFLTIHDLNHWRLPRNYSHWHRWYYRWLVRPAVRKATTVLTVSRFSQKELSSCWNIPESQIEMIYNGVNLARFHPRPILADIAHLRRKESLPPKFVLYVGGDKPHKNLSMAIRAMNLLPEELSLPMIAIGNFSNKSADPGAGIHPRFPFRILRVTEAELPLLYVLATLVCFPSFYEGFGFPIVEAFASGTPVVTSSTTACGEIAGSAALTVAPDRPEELARAIASLLQDKELYHKIRASGLERASQFTWDAAAHKLTQLYQRFI